jgi:hypothetical protein
MSENQRSLFLNVYQDKERRVWGVARICLADGSCLCIESKIYREYGVEGAVAGDDEPPKNQALDEALDKLCKVVAQPVVRAAIPLPARLALALVCKARNLQKIKKAAELDDNTADVEEAVGELRQLHRSQNPITRRAVNAMRLWR